MTEKKVKDKEFTEWYDKNHNFKKKYFNPSCGNIGISHIFCGILLEGSASGKCKVLLEIIYRYSFVFVILF